MPGAFSHVKSNTIADFTGTFTGFNSQGSTTTIAATDIVRPSDWNSAHNVFGTLSGNTSNSSTFGPVTNVVLAGGAGVTLAITTGANVVTISINGAPIKSGYFPYADREHLTGQVGQGTLIMNPEYLPNVQFDRVLLPIFNTNSSNSSGSHTLSFWVGFYSRNASTLSLVVSTSSSTAVTHSGTAGSYSLYSGLRHFSIPITTTLTEGDYWVGILSRTTSGGANGTYSQILLTNMTAAFLGHFGSSNNTTMQFTLGQGVYTVTTSAIPGSIGFSQIRGSNSMAFRNPIHMLASGTV